MLRLILILLLVIPVISCDRTISKSATCSRDLENRYFDEIEALTYEGEPMTDEQVVSSLQDIMFDETNQKDWVCKID